MIEEVIHELNCISRMAVIENAPKTGRLSVCTMRYLKYKYRENGNEVVAVRELEHAENLLELEQLKGNYKFSYQVEGDAQLNGCFVPYYSIVGEIERVLLSWKQDAKVPHITLKCYEEHQHTVILVLLNEVEYARIICQ